jgi:hypothetical protein
MGTFYVLMHATPVVSLFDNFCTLPLEPDTGYQWAPFACRYDL